MTSEDKPYLELHCGLTTNMQPLRTPLFTGLLTRVPWTLYLSTQPPVSSENGGWEGTACRPPGGVLGTGHQANHACHQGIWTREQIHSSHARALSSSYGPWTAVMGGGQGPCP